MFKTIEQLKNKEKGFSLLELSVAVGIAAIVAAVAITATTGFVNGAAGSAELYEAGADQSIVDASDSFDALGQLDPNRERGGVTGLNNAGGGNGGNNDSTPPENNEPESPFPIAFDELDLWLGIAGSFWTPQGDPGFDFGDNLQILFDNTVIGHYIEFVDNHGNRKIYQIDSEGSFHRDGAIGGAIYTNPLIYDDFDGSVYIASIILHGAENPLG